MFLPLNFRLAPPELVVRVAGYSAYFDDLPDSAKDEIIKRTRLKV